MSKQYDYYLEQHKSNVAKGFNWIKENLPELIVDMGTVDYEHQICFLHDHSKSQSDEYEAYDAYFYGGNRSYQVVQDFNYAWLNHIHRNPHHWQHWILLNDEPNEGEIILDMPYNYILEMICDWWAFSWSKGNLRAIFDWWNEHSKWIKISDKTRQTVITILDKIATKLDQLDSIKEEYRKSDLTMSEFLRSFDGLTVSQKKELLNWSGDDEYVTVTDTGEIVDGGERNRK